MTTVLTLLTRTLTQHTTRFDTYCLSLPVCCITSVKKNTTKTFAHCKLIYFRLPSIKHNNQQRFIMVEVATNVFQDLCDVFGCVATPHTQRHSINNPSPHGHARTSQRLPFDVESDQESDFFDDQMLGLPGHHPFRRARAFHEGENEVDYGAELQPSGPCIYIPFFQSCVSPPPRTTHTLTQHTEIPLPLSWQLPNTRALHHHAGLHLPAATDLGMDETEDTDEESVQESDETLRVECPVCLETKLDVVLTCGHAVCRKCLHALFVAKTIEASATHTGGTVWQAKCPKCRLKTPDHRLRRLFL
eukprot:TRINITY_DN2163_c0_g1_i1.p1 TRINITY_DN2163_c0_g1~~TRINITY_DN2163_c0_g1_i1.p1  ORF type:complete len:303 (+),score=33.38 TRINITY_DN2163_c0_g1_i1:24-932(+)